MIAIAQMLGFGSSETIRTWIRRGQVDAGDRPGVTTDAAAEIKRLKRGNAELRRANEILKTVSASSRPNSTIGITNPFDDTPRASDDSPQGGRDDPVVAPQSADRTRRSPSLPGWL